MNNINHDVNPLLWIYSSRSGKKIDLFNFQCYYYCRLIWPSSRCLSSATQYWISITSQFVEYRITIASRFVEHWITIASQFVEYRITIASPIVPWVSIRSDQRLLITYQISIAWPTPWVSGASDQHIRSQDCCWVWNIDHVSICWVSDNDHVSSNSSTIGYWSCLQLLEYWISIVSPIPWVLYNNRVFN